jgi:hypothetical protein
LFKRSTLGRPTVPARVMATVMLLQAYEGLSDREACDRLAFDLRWKAAAGLTVGALAGRSPDGGTNKLLGLMGFAQMSAGERSLGLH